MSQRPPSGTGPPPRSAVTAQGTRYGAVRGMEAVGHRCLAGAAGVSQEDSLPERRRRATATGRGASADVRGCFDIGMTSHEELPYIASASRDMAAGAARIFELIADPTQQPRWDGNDNLAEAPSGQRVRAVGEVFTMTLTRGSVRENHVVEFEEGRRIAWRPADPGEEPAGHLWRWELEPIDSSRTRVTHTYGPRPVGWCRSSACCSAVLLTMPSVGRAGRSPRSARCVGCPGWWARAG